MRRLLIGVIVLVFLTVLFNYLQGHYARMRETTEAPQILSSEMVGSAEDLTYSQHNDGVLEFEIRAQRVLETREGRKLLQDIVAYDFNPDKTIRNEIRSQNAEYDAENRRALFSGDVRIYLEDEVEMRTDSLHYDLKTKIGTTQDFLEFSAKEARGNARGVRFDQKGPVMDLYDEVDLVLTQTGVEPNALFTGEKLHAMSDSAHCSESMGSIIFRGDVRIESGSDVLSGDEVEAILSSDQRRIVSLKATGNAAYESASGGEMQVLKGDEMHFAIHESGKAVEKISVRGQAEYSSVSGDAEFNLRGGEIYLDLDAGNGIPIKIESRPDVELQMKRDMLQTTVSGNQLEARFNRENGNPDVLYVRNRASMRTRGDTGSANQELLAEEIQMNFRNAEGPLELEKLRAQKAVRWTSRPPKNADTDNREPDRTLSASFLELIYSSQGNYFKSGNASGDVLLGEISSKDKTVRESRSLLADFVFFRFFPGGNQLKDLEAQQNVQAVYSRRDAVDGSQKKEEFRTSSDKMQAVFELRDGYSTIATVSQQGDFIYKDATRSAKAGKGDYDANAGILVLTDDPVILDEVGSTMGERMEYDQKRKMLSVSNRVRSVLSAGNEGGAFFTPSSSDSSSIITAETMRYWMETGRVRYADNIQLLSENGQLQAEMLEIFNNGERIEAQGEIKHLVTMNESYDKGQGNEAADHADKSSEGDNSSRAPMTVRSSTLKYSKDGNTIEYGGNVTLHWEDIELHSVSLDAVLDKKEGKIKYATARGEVRIYQGKRQCKGDEAEFYLGPGRFVVTGNPAEVYDPGRGRSFARRLTSFTADDSIRLENR